MTEEKGISIYAHMPFCRRKCLYCDFNSISPASFPEERYVESLVGELSEAVASMDGRRRLESVYIGGGTPSLFSLSSIKHLMEGVRGFFPGSSFEATIEANPDSLGAEKLEGYLSSGINRLSVGVQSLDDRDLKVLGRLHSAEDGRRAFLLAREAGFENIGIDLIFGIPGQGFHGWERVLRSAAALRPEHLSAYNLTIEEGTPFHGLYKQGALTLPPEDVQLSMFGAARKVLDGEGYTHYEISNYALPGRESRHNTAYWRGGDYIGLGAGAHSYISQPGWGRRSWNERDPFLYMERIASGSGAAAGGETLGREEAISESLLLGLRLLERGVDGRLFKERFGFFPKELLHGRLKELEEEGLIRLRGTDLVFTEEGMVLSDSVFVEMLASSAGN